MRKRIRIFISIMIAIVMIWGSIFTIDVICCSSLKKTIFVIPMITSDDGGSGTYQGIGYSVEIKTFIQEGRVFIQSAKMRLFGKQIVSSFSAQK